MAAITRKARVQRTPEEKWEIVLEGLRSGNVAETCRRYGIAPNVYHRWKEEAQARIERYLWDYHHNRPHRGLGDRTPQEAMVGFESDLRIEALRV